MIGARGIYAVLCRTTTVLCSLHCHILLPVRFLSLIASPAPRKQGGIWYFLFGCLIIGKGTIDKNPQVKPFHSTDCTGTTQHAHSTPPPSLTCCTCFSTIESSLVAFRLTPATADPRDEAPCRLSSTGPFLRLAYVWTKSSTLEPALG